MVNSTAAVSSTRSCQRNPLSIGSPHENVQQKRAFCWAKHPLRMRSNSEQQRNAARLAAVEDRQNADRQKRDGQANRDLEQRLFEAATGARDTAAHVTTEQAAQTTALDLQQYHHGQDKGQNNCDNL